MGSVAAVRPAVRRRLVRVRKGFGVRRYIPQPSKLLVVGAGDGDLLIHHELRDVHDRPRHLGLEESVGLENDLHGSVSRSCIVAQEVSLQPIERRGGEPAHTRPLLDRRLGMPRLVSPGLDALVVSEDRIEDLPGGERRDALLGQAESCGARGEGQALGTKRVDLGRQRDSRLVLRKKAPRRQPLAERDRLRTHAEFRGHAANLPRCAANGR